MRKMRTLLGLALVAVFLAPAAGATFDQWLPEGTIFYASVEDVSSLCDRAGKGPMGALWREEAMLDFLELPRQRLDEAVKDATAKMGGANPMDLLGMMKGQVSMAFTGLRKTEDGKLLPGVVLLADVGDQGTKLLQWLGRVEQSDEFKKNVRLVEDEFRGTKIVSWINTDADDGEDEDPDGAMGGGEEMGEPIPCYFVKGNTFAFATDAETLKDILNRQEAEAPSSLAGGEIYRTVRRRTGAGADVVFFVNVAEIYKLAADKMEEQPDVAKAFGALGLMNVKAFGGRMSLGELDSTYHMFLYAPGEKTGIMKVLGGQNTALMPPKFVPTGVASAMTMAFDVQELWAETKRIVSRMDPNALKMLEQQLAGMKEQMGLDIEADLIGSFGKSLTVYSFAPEISEDEEEEPGPMGPGPNMMGRFVMALEVSNAEKLTGAIDTLLQMAPLPLETEEYMGVTLNSMNVMVAEIHFATVAGHFVLAANIDDLRAVVQTQGKEAKGLAASEEFTRALARLPQSRSMVYYADPRQSMAMLSQMMETMGPMIMMQNPEVAEWIDFSLFPSGDVLTKYMDVGGTTMMTEEDGISIIGVSLMKMPK